MTSSEVNLAKGAKRGMLSGLRVLEIADELGEYCGLLLAGLGADVVKVERPNGSSTRSIGPFFEDHADPERSLYFWSYNRQKRSIVLEYETEAGAARLLDLLSHADVLLDSTGGNVNAALRLSGEELRKRFPTLIVARVTPFGDVGPWKDFKGSDLVHLALGGVMMNCGYDPAPGGRYDLAPAAPQLWHAYHITGEQLAIGVTAALLHRESTGRGQDVSCAVHEAVAKSTEMDLMSWVMRRAPFFRQTCRHATEAPSRVPTICHTKDGRWYIPWGVTAQEEHKVSTLLDRYGMAADLRRNAADSSAKGRVVPGYALADDLSDHRLEVIQRFVRAFRYEDVPWLEAQELGLPWAPLRRPHENAFDEHWLRRGTFREVPHPELGRSFRYPVSKWVSTITEWQSDRRAPLLGEHTDEVLREAAWTTSAPEQRSALKHKNPRLSKRGKPFALQDIRILDFSWFLASAGGTRFLAGLGAECIKVEWKSNPDTRLSVMAPVGGRAAREKATSPLPGVSDPDMGGHFNNKNPGKRGMSLNIRDPRGLQIAKQLVAICDVVAEGFSPGVLERNGLGYDVLKSIRPDIIYAQQSGMGSLGTYGRMRTLGPVAAAFAGTSEMSGLPEPAMPAGWGYSYLDWFGAYSFALSILGGLYHRARTGEGQWIDSSQCEAGIFLTAPTVLDYLANGREWRRLGNRSPYKPAAPHGAYRCLGDDRWIAIACFTQQEWNSLADVAAKPQWKSDARFKTLEARLANQTSLDAEVTAWTLRHDPYDCMARLQAGGVAAGVCQNAADRCDTDAQLKALDWLTEVHSPKIGTWPLAELPMKLTETPAYIGGITDRGAPCYGEDNEYVLGELLGYSVKDIKSFETEGVI